MKILFVCRENTGRSQVAETLYNHYTNTMDAQSAGTIVDESFRTVGDRPPAASIILVMKNRGLDISANLRTQVNESMQEKYDKIVVIAELSTVPEWLKKSDKVEYWDVEDVKDESMQEALRITREIESKLPYLIQD